MAHLRLFGHYVHTPYLLMSAFEAVLLVAAAYIGHFLRYGVWPDLWQHLMPAGTYALIVIVSMMAMGVYESRIREGYSAMMLRTGVAIFLLGSLSTAVLSYASQMLFMSRGTLLLSGTTAFVLIAVWRWLAFASLDEQALKKRVVVLGAGHRALKIASRMRRRSDQRAFQLLGFLRTHPMEKELVSSYGGFVFSNNMTLQDFCREYQVDEIVVAADERRRGEFGPGLPLDDLIDCRLSGVNICDVQQFVEREACRVDVDLLRPGWLAFADGFVMRTRHRLIKRAFDLIAGSTILALAWPVMLLTALAIRLESRGPVIYRQERIGKDGVPFRLAKFRSMYHDPEADDQPTWTRLNDPRVTRVGAFIRKTRVDELPQLLNVLRGDMSFVGPRPERPTFVRELTEKIPYYAQRHRVKPGITGWAQLCYPYGASVQDAKEKLQYDLYYLKNQSPLLDLIILLQTVEVVLIGDGAR